MDKHGSWFYNKAPKKKKNKQNSTEIHDINARFPKNINCSREMKTAFLLYYPYNHRDRHEQTL